MPGSAVLSAAEGGSRKEKKSPAFRIHKKQTSAFKSCVCGKFRRIMMIKLCDYPVITEPGFWKHML